MPLTMKTIYQSTLRILLVVLIGTFMAPGFAWQMIDSHSELAGTSVVVDSTVPHESCVHHQHHDDDAAHGEVGHLLSHLPVFIYEATTIFLPATALVTYPASGAIIAYADAEPPFKPPRNSPLI